jgi:tRNA 2-thiocytidine biosynthesis protein TtcA
MDVIPADRKIFRTLGRAIRHYDLIEVGDRIAVAVSGGKDSLSLLWLLWTRLRWVPVRYELTAVHLDPGFPGHRPAQVEAFCRALGVPLRWERTDYGPRAHSPENRENPCFFCSRLRRKRLFELAAELGCSKLALGHNQDDIIETLFLNVFYSGEIGTMVPRQPLFSGALTLIRPLALTAEKEIKSLVRRKGWAEMVNTCPSAGVSSRAAVKKMLNDLYATNRKIRGNTFRALSSVRWDYLLPEVPRGRRP